VSFNKSFMHERKSWIIQTNKNWQSSRSKPVNHPAYLHQSGPEWKGWNEKHIMYDGHQETGRNLSGYNVWIIDQSTNNVVDQWVYYRRLCWGI